MRRRGYPNCMTSVSTLWNLSDRDDKYTARCGECAQWTPNPTAAIAAHRNARRHATRFPGHSVAVYNLTRLEIVHEYEHEALRENDEPPF